MKKIILVSLSIGISLLAAACGSNGKAPNGEPPAADKPEPKIGGKVVGPCTLAGDIRSFEITAPKSFRTYGFVTDKVVLSYNPKEKLIMNTILNGVEYDMNIEAQGTKLIGFEKLANNIDLIIAFADSSKCEVSLWVAN